MINTTIKYIVYNHAGSGVRHHHFGTQNNIVDEADGHASTGDFINALGFPTLPFSGQNLPFAFMSVHGGADGNQLYHQPGEPSGSSRHYRHRHPCGVLDRRAALGVRPDWVDAFNVDTGNFSR